MASVHRKPNSPFWMMKFRAEDGRVVMRSTKQTDRRKAQTIADETERMARKARLGELTQAVVLKTLGELMERTTGETLQVETIKQFFERWLTSKEKVGKASSTVKRYRPILASFLAFLGDRRTRASIGSVSALDISRFRDFELDQGKSHSTADFSVKVLQAVLSAAHRQGLILSNPAMAVERLNGQAEERKPFTEEQVKVLLGAADEEWRGMVLLGFHTGIRLNDAANLLWKNFDIENRTLSFTEQKTAGRKRSGKRETTVFLHSDLIQWAKTQPSAIGNAPVFPNLFGKSSGSTAGLSNAFNALMKKANIVSPLGEEKKGKGRRFRLLGFHSLRHTFISRLANSDVSPDVRKAMAGHSNDDVHRRYVHLDISAQARAVERMSSVL